MNHLDFTLSLIDKLTRPLKTAQSSLSGFAEKSQASFTKIGIGAAAVWGVAQSIAGVVGPAYEMNAALAEVGSKGVAEDALKRLSGEAMRFSMRYGKGAVDVVRSSYAMKGAMAGLSDMDLPRVTIAANTLAAGVKASGEEAGEYIGAMASRFNAELSSLGHVRFAEELAGKTAYMVQNFGVKMQTMQELIEGTKSAGADFGVSLDEQFAVLGTLSRTLGTEASGIYEQFLRSAPAAAEKLGMSFVDATGKMLPMGDILQKLQSKYGQSIEGNVKAQQALDAAFGGGADVIKKLYGQQDKLNRSITELGRNDGMKRAQEMAERMAEPWERIKATFFAIRVAIGNTLIPILSPLMNRIADVGTKFARWLDMFPNIARWLGYITLGVLSFGLAGAAVNIVMGVFGFTMTGLAAIAKVLGGAWKLLLWTLNLLRPSLLTTRIGLAALWIQSKLLALWTGVCRIALAAWNIALKTGAIAMRVYGVATMFAGAAMQFLMSPITLIIAGLALLAVGVWYVITHWKELAAAIMNTAAFAWVMSVAEQVGQVFARVWQSITDGWAVVVDFFAGLSPLATFEGFAQIIGGVFSKLFDVLKSTFVSTYNWIVEKLNKIPGVNIDLKTVSPPAAAAVPANAVIPDSAAGSSKLNSPSVLTGNRINADIPRGGLMSQVKTDRKTTVDNRKSWGDTYINAPNGITPAQLAEWQELNAG
ncbi:phage tail tape measure protein [Salmonella enterica subsp. enterica serovar Colindale]|uniref:Phage tail tape measure protein n=1 Tax=Salmonella enterica subsp. enterica serovar Colindale TaxID=1967991 RepID=A0A5W8C8J4_SALET|nr:phage tail tape measure protein [Salmonella enterica]EBU8330792.1 phage tail tape measure protein [Salmonella enterica subsp. enterica serovar Berkeley]EBY0289811.1 phage tail tape measure protein [Salmonella enterica subsp. enterica serovar Colindale]EEV4846270.1 phage tail tape measure protein [Salmonella enterica subsp. enterica serovar Montevideo]EIJ2084328.1 phage tail tape measure protein [Salmonella enterica subsp. enterica serovar Johannesburg]MLC35788.1 phage tail tape measure prot